MVWSKLRESARGASRSLDNAAETEFIANAAADLVGEARADRIRSLIMRSEGFAYMLEAPVSCEDVNGARRA
jgi:hypothetical protein